MITTVSMWANETQLSAVNEFVENVGGKVQVSAPRTRVLYRRLLIGGSKHASAAHVTFWPNKYIRLALLHPISINGKFGVNTKAYMRFVSYKLCPLMSLCSIGKRISYTGAFHRPFTSDMLDGSTIPSSPSISS